MSLVQQLADLDQTAPWDFDPEDVNFANEAPGDEDEFEQPTTSGREHYLDVGPSTLRNKLHDIDDPKYVGRKTSRKELQDASDEVSDESSGEEEEEGEEEESDSEGNGVEEPESNKIDKGGTTRADDLKKAKAVKRQKLLWNALVDARMRIQRAVVETNRLGKTELLAGSRDESLKWFLDVCIQFSDDISNLRRSLMVSNEGLQPPVAKRRKLDANLSEAVIEATNERNLLEKSLHPHLLQTLHKWSTRINAMSPSAILSTRTTTFRTRPNRIRGAAELIDEILVDDKVIGRTRVLRNTLNQIGSNLAPLTSSGEEEIFDDTDFYYQILRQVVDAKKNGDSDLFPPRPKKVKKIVDTKASKGRKLRFTVHDRIQNFMAPIPTPTWHEEQIDELFASLFGKGQDLHPASQVTLSDGFKLFN